MKYECECCYKAPLNENEVYICPFSHIIYCKECFGDLFGKCVECDEIYLLDDLKVENDKFYCQDCFNEIYSVCDECGIISERDCCDISYYESFDGWLCNDCYHEYYFYCDECERDISFDFSSINPLNNIVVCDDCYREFAKGNVLNLLKEFILFEQNNPFPERTLRIWILHLLDGNFKCPCILADYSCNVYDCPRKLSHCSANNLYSKLQRINRKFIRFYLLRKLLEIYLEVDNNEFLNSIGYKNLLELLQGCKWTKTFGF